MKEETRTLIAYRLERARDSLEEANILFYDRFFDNRQKGDYADLVRFDPDEVGAWYREANEFVEAVENIVRETLRAD